MSDTSTSGGGCSILLMAGLALLAAFVIFGAGASAGGGGTPSTSTSTTRTETNVHVLSDNTVRILSPDTYIYYNSGDTSQVVSGDRNEVGPVQTGGGQCWVSSAQAWGNCPAGAPAGAAVP